jgi:hypothetical protein
VPTDPGPTATRVEPSTPIKLTMPVIAITPTAATTPAKKGGPLVKAAKLPLGWEREVRLGVNLPNSLQPVTGIAKKPTTNQSTKHTKRRRGVALAKVVKPAATVTTAADAVVDEMRISSDEQSQLDPIIAECRRIYHEFLGKLFELGDEINKLRQAYHKMYRSYPHKETIAQLLKINLTPQRISHLHLTAEFIPPNLRDPKIAFERYKIAREINATRTKPLDAPEVVKIIRSTKNAEEIKARLAEPDSTAPKKKAKSLTLTVKATSNGVTIRYNGELAKISPDDDRWIPLMAQTARELITSMIRKASNDVNKDPKNGLTDWGNRIGKYISRQALMRGEDADHNKIVEGIYPDGFEEADKKKVKAASTARRWPWERDHNHGSYHCLDFTIHKVGGQWAIYCREHYLRSEHKLTDAKRFAETATNLPKEDGGIFPPALADTTTAAESAPADPVATAPPASPQPTPEQPSPAQPTPAPADPVTPENSLAIKK